MGIPLVIIHFSKVFPYKPSIIGYPPPFLGHPHVQNSADPDDHCGYFHGISGRSTIKEMMTSQLFLVLKWVEWVFREPKLKNHCDLCIETLLTLVKPWSSSTAPIISQRKWVQPNHAQIHPNPKPWSGKRKREGSGTSTRGASMACADDKLMIYGSARWFTQKMSHYWFIKPISWRYPLDVSTFL